MPDTYLTITKIFVYTLLAFLLALWSAPNFITLLRWLKFWKKKSRQINIEGSQISDKTMINFYKNDEAKMQIPRAGGILIWFTALFFAIFFWMLLKINPENKLFQYLNFVSRSQTFIPIATLFFGCLFGFIDDALSTLENGGNYKAGGLKLSHRFFLVGSLSTVIGWWFYSQLQKTSLQIFSFNLNFASLWGHNFGFLYVILTILVLMGLWSSSVIDGFDGLATSVFVPIYLCFGTLSYIRGYPNITVFLMIIVGAMCAFWWFNITPAKFYLGDTGSLGILLTIGVVAIMIDAIYIIPISGIMLVLTSLSVVGQVLFKKILKRKILNAAPLHHHFETLGFSRDQIVLRYSLVSVFASIVGVLCGVYFR
jgi:phospho-N-acetylmuramoyl-pentapeptide-transferase